MQNFTVINRSDKRFDGEFQVNPTAGYEPNTAEQAYLKQVPDALDTLAADAAQDKDESAQLPTEAISARARARDSAVASLRSVAEDDLAADEATRKVGEVLTKYGQELANILDGKQKFKTTEEDPRFRGDFKIMQADPWTILSDDDQKYLEQVRKLLRSLSDDASKDQDTFKQDSPKMRERIDTRALAASSLNYAVDWVGIQRTAKAAMADLEKTRERYLKAIARSDDPKLQIDERSEGELRFDGDFKIDLIEQPDGEELSRDYYIYVKQVREVLRQLAADEGIDKARNYPDLVLATRKSLRQRTADRLKKNASEVSQGSVDPLAAANAASTSKGMYLHELELTSGTLFTVSPTVDGQFATGLAIKVAENLPPPNNVAPPEKQELYTAILAVETVIKTVCNRIESGDADSLCGRMFTARRQASSTERAKLLRDEYMRKLASIGELGLQGPNTSLAKVALNSLRNEFVAHEGPRIKNSYVCRLGLACGIAAAIFLLAYVMIATGWITGEFWKLHRAFFLAGTGAAIGTWLSFSIREVELSFDHLGVVEADLLDPAFRVLFVVALTVTACLLFWTGVMNIEIGSLKTTASAFGNAGTIALLIGLFCGLSERALATSISGRAATFVKGISG